MTTIRETLDELARSVSYAEPIDAEFAAAVDALDPEERADHDRAVADRRDLERSRFGDRAFARACAVSNRCWQTIAAAREGRAPRAEAELARIVELCAWRQVTRRDADRARRVCIRRPARRTARSFGVRTRRPPRPTAAADPDPDPEPEPRRRAAIGGAS